MSDERPWLKERRGKSGPKTKEEWRKIVLDVPPPRPTLPSLAEYRTLSLAARDALEQKRVDYHSGMPLVPTPPMKLLHERMRTTVDANRHAPPGARRGHVMDGLGGTGKTSILTTFGREHELALRRAHPNWFVEPCVDYTPVVYISIPSAVTPRMLSKRFAKYLNVPYRSRADVTEITDSVLAALERCGTEIVIIDDIHFLDCSQKDGKVANDHLKDLANHCAATFLYAGVNVANGTLFGEGTSDRRTQTASRFSLLSLHPFAPDVPLQADAKMSEQARKQATEWANIVKSMEDALALYEHKPGSLATQHWRYLLDRTSGWIGSLRGLMVNAATVAIRRGVEAIDVNLLDELPTDITTDSMHRERHIDEEKGAGKPLSSTPRLEEGIGQQPPAA